MDMQNNNDQCFHCKTFEGALLRCQDCLMKLHSDHRKRHRDTLNEDINLIATAYDELTQTLDEYKQNSQNHSLIKHIDQWEKESIETIHETAKNCRQNVFERLQKRFRETESICTRLSEQIKEIQEEVELDEFGLHVLMEKLNKLDEELNNPSTFWIYEDQQPFINEIFVMSEGNSSLQQQYGVIVAGGNGSGNRLNQFNFPSGIFIDENNTIFISDRGNDRIVHCKCDGKLEKNLADEENWKHQMSRLRQPTDVVVDQQNHSIIVADRGNRRVIRWSPNEIQKVLIHDIDCYGLAMDEEGFLYVSDTKKNEVRKWKLDNIYTNREGILVAGGNGEGNRRNQLNYPTFIFVDEEQSLYVSDSENHRVMKWVKNTKQGVVVAGGNGCGNNHNQLNSPQGLFVDESNQLYVADCLNHRIMRWNERYEEGEIVVGGNGCGDRSNQLSHPNGVSFDSEGNLYVADGGNHRIMRFDKFE